jgi:uncharacterized damage-inducible protein DinB
MIKQTLTSLYKKDLQSLKKEIELYTTESNLWRIDKNITNSAGNLCLHLIGNLNTYIGSQLGNTGYIRQRDLEFSLKDIHKAELLKKIDETEQMVIATINNLTEEQLHQIHPVKVYDFDLTSAALLFYLTTHLSYHLGQINYHRRLLDN